MLHKSPTAGYQKEKRHKILVSFAAFVADRRGENISIKNKKS
jgi:hypothetical protein